MKAADDNIKGGLPPNFRVMANGLGEYWLEEREKWFGIFPVWSVVKRCHLHWDGGVWVTREFNNAQTAADWAWEIANSREKDQQKKIERNRHRVVAQSESAWVSKD